MNELRLPTKNGLQRQKRGRQERNIHLFSPVLQAYTWDNNIWEAPLPSVKQAEPTLNLKIECGPSLTKYNGACELFWQRSIKVVMGWLSGRGTEELMTSSPQLKKTVHPSTHPSLQNIRYFWPQALNRGSLACRGCEKCQGLKFPGQNSCRSQPDDVNPFYSVVWQNILHSSRITFRLDFYILKVLFSK